MCRNAVSNPRSCRWKIQLLWPNRYICLSVPAYRWREAEGDGFTDRIEIGVETESEQLRGAVSAFADYIGSETLAVDLRVEALPEVEPLALEVAGQAVKVYVRKKK